MKVDIVIPYFNTRPCYLKECLESIYNQTFQDFRIILINDGSFKYNYNSITLKENILCISNKYNSGISKSVNRAFSYVDSKYCIRIDSDDHIDKTLLQKEVDFLDNNKNYISTCCDIEKYWKLENNQIRKEIFVKRPKNWNMEDLLNKKYIGYGYSGGMMFRSSVLSEISMDESLPICEDFKFHVELLKRGKIHSIPEILYYYRKHLDQTTQKYRKHQRLSVINNIISNLR